METILGQKLSIGAEVITETGELLGWLRKVGVTDDLSTTNSAPLILSNIRFLWIPEIFFGTFELSITEVISSGPHRLIVFEGAENRVKVLRIGVLERLGISKSPRKADGAVECLVPISAGNVWKDENDNVWKDEDDQDEDGFSTATVPRRPNPKPSDSEAEIPLE
jgi:hypothetical protein